MNVPNEVLHLAGITQEEILRVVGQTIFTPTKEVRFWYNQETGDFEIWETAVETFGWL